jgi:ABC-type nitrate/sulfonate/bicarbonate transport system substrate-binding protein
MKVRKFRILPLVLSSILLLTGCGGGSNTSETNNDPVASTDSGATSEFPLRIINTTGFNELCVADGLGFFKDAGIKLVYIGALSSGVSEFQLLAQGEIDAFTTSHPPSIAQARIAGIKVRATVPGMIDDAEYNHVRYLVQNGSDIQSLSDLKGKQVGVGSLSACSDGYVKYYLKKNGLNPDDTEFVVISGSGMIEQALSQGLVDVITSHPPQAGKLLATGTVRQVGSSWETLHSPGAGLSTRGFSEQFIAEHPDVVQGFGDAMYRARLWINSHMEEAKTINAAFLNLDANDLSAFYYDPNKNIDPSYIDQWFEISEEIELWAHGDLAPADVFNNDYVPKEVPESDKTLVWDGNFPSQQ